MPQVNTDLGGDAGYETPWQRLHTVVGRILGSGIELSHMILWRHGTILLEVIAIHGGGTPAARSEYSQLPDGDGGLVLVHCGVLPRPIQKLLHQVRCRCHGAAPLRGRAHGDRRYKC